MAAPVQLGQPQRRDDGLDDCQTGPDHLLDLEDFEAIAQEVSALGRRISELEHRLERAEKVNAGLEQAALTTSRALQEIWLHWDKVYEAVRGEDDPTETDKDD